MLPKHSDKPLFTPGPLTTSLTVKQAMLRDLGPRDHQFKQLIEEVRQGILEIAGLTEDSGYEAILMQGCGTMGLEAVLSTAVPPNGRVLVVTNGAYGRRILKMTQILPNIESIELAYEEHRQPDPADIDRALAGDPQINMVVVVHCETTSGISNPIEEIGQIVKKHNRRYFVDSMSSFGAVPIDFKACGIDYLVSSANKCIEGVPGFSFVICRRNDLETTDGWSRTLSLDLLAQLHGFEFDGQFLYTPPTHSMLAFRQAIAELEEEGGVEARGKRYAANHRAIVDGMRQLGFQTYLPDELQSYIITTFYALEDPNFVFSQFYDLVEDKGFVIYGGKVLNDKTFRIGHIGRLFEQDMHNLLNAIEKTLIEMGVNMYVPEDASKVIRFPNF